MKFPAILVVLALTVPANLKAQSTVLSGGTLIDGTGGPAIGNSNVVIENGRILCVGPATDCEIPEDFDVVDVSGRFITPGLIDAHVHFSQTGWIDGRPDGLTAPDVYPYSETTAENRDNPHRWHRSYLCNGITGVFDVGGHPWTTALPAAAENDPTAVHVRAAGPLITHASVPALNLDEEHYTFLPMGTSEEVQNSVAAVVEMGSSAVKVWYLRPRPADREHLDARLMEIGALAEQAGLDLIVHATSLREAKMALRAGAKLLVHSVQDTLVDQEFLDLMARNGTTYAPTLVVGRNWSRAMASIMLNRPHEIDDPNSCVDPGTVAKIGNTEILQDYLPERMRSVEAALRRVERSGNVGIMMENLRRVHAAGLYIATATDAGNPFTLHGPSIYNEMEAMQAVGISATDVIVMSTKMGAAIMNRLNDIGTLEPGKIADLIILTENPLEDVRAFRGVTHVMRMGQLYRQTELSYTTAN